MRGLYMLDMGYGADVMLWKAVSMGIVAFVKRV